MILSKILMVGFLYLKDYLWLILFGLISQASKVFLTEKQAKMHFTLDTYLKIGITQKMDKGKSLFVYFSSLMRILQNVVCESNSSNCDWITRFHLILNSVSYNIFEKILVFSYLYQSLLKEFIQNVQNMIDIKLHVTNAWLFKLMKETDGLETTK